MKVICISGKAQHGKDTTANILMQQLTEQGNKVLIAHYADLVKYICRTFFNWNGEKDEYGRSLLQRVGTEDVRTVFPNFWVDFIVDILTVFNDEWDYVLIPDTRFPNEIQSWKDKGWDVISLRVTRTEFISSLTEQQKNHLSEISLDNYNFDYYINAKDINGLEIESKKFIKEMLNAN